MAEFITKCPHCNIELQVQEEWVGMEVGCPQCQKTFTITPNVPVKKLVTGQSTFLTNKLNKYVNTIKEAVNFTKTPPLTTPNENAVTRNYFRDKLNLYVITMGIATFLFLK